MVDFTYFELLYSIPILLLINYIFIKFNFVKLNPHDPDYKTRTEKRIKQQRMLLLFRSILIVLMVLAISDPIIKTHTDLETDPYIKIIVDKSSSMELFSENKINDLITEIGVKVDNLKILSFGNDISPGLFLSTNANQGEHILFITDGWDNINGDLSNSINYVKSLNSTVHTLQLHQQKKDSPISILGPSKVIEDIDNAFKVKILGKNNIKISVDNNEIFKGEIEDSHDLKLSFLDGSHTIKAEILKKDYFSQNNIFYKTVHTIKKPKIAMVGPANVLYNTLSKKYDITKFSSIPNDLTNYHLVIVYDKNIDELGDTSSLESFIIDGCGVIVFGGSNSYDRGGYEGSNFEKLLPVSVASAQRKRSPSNIALIVDVSESGKDFSGAGISVLDLQKSVAHEFVKNTAGYHNLGLIVFAYRPYSVSEMSTLVEKKQSILSDITKLQAIGGGTYIAPSLRMAKQFFVNAKGDKNIVLISDGKQFLRNSDGAVREMIKVAGDLRETGIKIHVIQTGEISFESLRKSLEQNLKNAKSDPENYGSAQIEYLESVTDREIREKVDLYKGLFDDSMKAISEITNGYYFKLNDRKKLNILFSDPDGEDFEPQNIATFIDSNHFISRDLSLNAKLPGFNNVVSKSSGRVIATLDTGEPVITTRRYGLGRSVSVTAFNPPSGLGELINHKEVIGRMINYGIGDPNRLESFVIEVKDGFANTTNTITVKSDIPPTHKKLVFSSIKPNVYESSIMHDSIGVFNIFNKPYSINYNPEYLNLGYNEDFISQIRLFGGTEFDYDADQIIEYLRSINIAKQTKTIYVFKYFIMLAILIYLSEIFIRRYLSKT